MLQLIAFNLLLFMQSPQNPLAPYTWKNRVLLVQCDGQNGAAYTKTMAEIAAMSHELQDRDLKVISYCADQIMIDGQQTSSAESQQLKTLFHPNSDSFELQLIGKDGGRKLRSSTYVPLADVFATIDAMPMRRSETKRSGNP